MLIVVGVAFAKLVLHCVFNNRYGYFRDEFDYLACGDHLAWGYVDQPPLLPFLVRISRAVLGDSLRSIRFLPALATSAVVVLTALIAREFGGRRFALVLSAVAVLIAPVYLSGGSLLTTNSLEPLLWMACVYFALLALKRDARYWLCFGVVAGLGLQEKYSIAIFGFGMAVGLLISKQRRALLSKWFWIGGLAAFLVFLPNLIWNVQHHWPFLELMHNIKTTGKDVQLSPIEYFAPADSLAPSADSSDLDRRIVCPAVVSAAERTTGSSGGRYVISFTAFVVLKGKNYYLAPIYPMLFAAGAITLENGIERVRQGWLKPAILVLLLAGGAWFAPIVVPVLPIDRFIAYLDTLPFKVPRTEHSHMSAALPQHYADQFGWEEMTAMTAQAWSRIKPEERPDCGIFAQDYGQAGAIDFFGRRYGLPPALSGHQTYFLWGPRGYSGNCLIVLDDRKEVLEQKFEQVEYVGSSDSPYALERNIPVFICKGAKFGSLAQIWPQLKKWR